MNKTVKRGLHLLIISAITAIFGVLTVFGVSAEVGDTFVVNTMEGCPITYGVTSEGAFPEVEVADCLDEYNGAVTLPENVVNPNNNLEYSVTSIGEYAFYDCKNLTSVTMPDSVTTIGFNSFANCSSLTNVTLPDSVTTIGYSAFFSCTSLKSVTMPDSVTTIEDNAFAYCFSLNNVTIPDSVTSIGIGAFDFCENLTSVIIPDGVTTIENTAFAHCFNLKSVTIPDSVTKIDEWAFAYCENLTSVTIPDSVTTIERSAFFNCINLSEVISYSYSPATLGYDVFKECPSNLKIYIPAETKEAYVAAGWPENNLSEIVIG